MTTPQQPKRFGWAFLLLVCLFWLGLAIGTAIGSQFVPSGSGMAGSVIALGYGVMCAFFSLAIGGLVAWKASVQTLRSTALVAGVVFAVLASLAGWRYATQHAAEQAERGLDVPLPASQSFQFDSALAEEDTMRAYRELHIDGTDWSFNYIAVGPEANACNGSLKAAEVTALTESLEAVRSRLDSGTPMCDGLTPGNQFTVYFDGDDGAWSTAGSISCLQRETELMALYTTLSRIPRTAVGEGRVQCD